MTNAFDYETSITRNNGYITAETQAKIRRTRLLIAGCGIGSSPAVCAARMGFENFVLVDGDVVDAHNLNRQFYDFSDIGKPKVAALKDKILRINPLAQVEAIEAYLDADNTDDIVGKADIVFDTVDFLDLPAILRLHDSAKQHKAHIFTALSVGFGALVWYFPADSSLALTDMLAPDIADVSAGGAVPSYADVFASFIQRLAPHLDAEVVEQVSKVLTMMKDGKPCPASQVAVGSFAIGAMAMSMIHDLLAGNPVPSAPKLVLHSFRSYQTKIVDVSVSRTQAM
ncbi:MAG: thiamine biosynthesis protein ThiF [Rhodoferax sp.]|uniref:ThiF family adenylyltransferase n=1 Tax=Rhodoferax sp. TaxID=50421 RepID=UPI0014001B81|nr:ThiF family adenylyltransferase [Rhodoferax sp.]NDP37837.1 thiamine biosynthesis protein ThiF [Rhodoferax sp.]